MQDDGDETVSETGSESMLTDLNTEEGMKKIDKVMIRLSRLSVVENNKNTLLAFFVLSTYNS